MKCESNILTKIWFISQSGDEVFGELSEFGYGAEVTGVCSSRNVDLVMSLGADHIIDYEKQNLSDVETRYDVIISTIGYQPISRYRKLLVPGGTYVSTGGSLRQTFEGLILGPWLSIGSKKTGAMMAHNDRNDLLLMKELLESEKVSAVIDRIYPLAETKEALQYYITGRSQGKVVISVIDSGQDSRQDSRHELAL
ncbi:MAG: NAD(P)-dependent alcohol dehydrogenase [Spirochaetia bacterium]